MLLVQAPAAEAKPARRFAIAAGSLSDALLVFAQQAGVSIAVGSAKVQGQHTPGLRGQFATDEALRRLLQGSGLTFVMVDAATIRIVAAPTHVVKAPPPRPAAPTTTPSANPPPPATGAEIVVVATKQRASIADYPASVLVLQPSPADTARGGGDGTAFVLGRLPGVASTNLGPGRNKLFIRGIADSSFNGRSQSTISQYLGEARLIYSAPDPDLLLYDVDRVEVLEGPQGTLYGAGTLGGIIRLEPHAPDLAEASLALSSGVRFTRSGAPGYDAAAIANLPLRSNLAARVVAYNTQEGGYIDDVLRRRSNVNRNRITGARASLRWKPASDWTIDVGLVGQDIASRDGQYADTRVGRLARASAIAQPFDNDYRLGVVTVTHSLGSAQLVSATAYTNQEINTVFDATRTPGVTTPRAYTEHDAISFFSHETRLSGTFSGRGTWLLGAGVIQNQDRARRSIGVVGQPQLLTSVANLTFDSAVFGEGTMPVLPHLKVTLGGRLSYVSQASEFTGALAEPGFKPERDQVRIVPTAGLAWQRNGLLTYLRYQESYRPGALQISGSGSRATAVRFDRDHIRTVELGLRFGNDPGARLSGSLAASSAQWSDIQADLVDIQGLPFTANIGSGRVRNLAATLEWHPGRDVHVDASGFLASSNLDKPAPGYDVAADRDLPNIADEGWRIGARYDHQFATARLSLDAGLRHVGKSQLAVRPPFNLPQGGYYDLSLGGRVAVGRIGLSLDASNLLDTAANTFSFGNPFSLAAGTQITPVRPRSFRLGLDANF